MIVRDIMTDNPRTVEVTDNINDALDVLHDLDVRHVPVVEAGRLVGMLSDRDLRSYSLPAIVEMRNPDKAAARLEQAVSDIMRGDVVSVGPEIEVTELVRMMIDQKYGAVPVVDQVEGTLVGIVSYLDVLMAIEDLL